MTAVNEDQRLLHIAVSAEWEEALRTGSYDRSTAGASLDDVGFIHCSRGIAQVNTVLSAVYAGLDTPLVLLHIDERAALAAGLRIVDEPGNPRDPESELFPHLYGGPLPVGAVQSTEPLPARRALG